MMSGSMQWQVDLGNMTVDLVSRRSLAEQLREIAIGGPTARDRAAATGKKKAKKEKIKATVKTKTRLAKKRRI